MVSAMLGEGHTAVNKISKRSASLISSMTNKETGNKEMV